MKRSEALLPEFDNEMANTRKVLERISEEKFSWKPHEKSFTMQKLATHVATLASWIDMTLKQDVLDIAEDFKMPEPSTRSEMLSLFDQGVSKAREVIASASDETFFSMWTLKKGDQVFFTMPKIAVYRSFVMNHMIHHRAQLTVYLRLNDIPVPAIYGPSADEGV